MDDERETRTNVYKGNINLVNSHKEYTMQQVVDSIRTNAAKIFRYYRKTKNKKATLRKFSRKIAENEKLYGKDDHEKWFKIT